MTRTACSLAWLPALAALLMPVPASAWGSEGHEVIAAIARADLTPDARRAVDAILAADPDTLTAPDMLSRATWADAWRAAGHRETGSWHFVDIELDHPDLEQACFGFPPMTGPASARLANAGLAKVGMASAGPAEDCVVHKVEQFTAELGNPATQAAERLLALKYLMHLVGDMHQPLHASDNHDRGGNCVRIDLGGPRTVTLHGYWDTIVVEEQGDDPQALADRLRARITPADRAAWQQGGPRDWAMEAFGVAKRVAYAVGSAPGCDRDAAPLTLPAGYDARARDAADLQLERAGLRLALVLNRTLGSTPAAGR